MATPTGGLDLAGLIQAAQLGRSLNPEVMQQQALGNQLAQQLQLLQIKRAQQELDPNFQLSRDLYAALGNPLSGIEQTQGGITDVSPTLASDIAALESMDPNVRPESAVAQRVYPRLGTTGEPLGFQFNPALQKQGLVDKARLDAELNEIIDANKLTAYAPGTYVANRKQLENQTGFQVPATSAAKLPHIDRGNSIDFVDPLTNKVISSFPKSKDTRYEIRTDGVWVEQTPGKGDFKLQGNAPSQTSAASAYQAERTRRVVADINNLLPRVTKSVTGRTARLQQSKLYPDVLRGDEIVDFEADLQSLKSNIFQNELAAMRASSKTGGAVGNVSNREGDKLEAALGALDNRQSDENLVANLIKARDSIEAYNQVLADNGVSKPSPTGGKKTLSSTNNFPTEEAARAAGFGNGSVVIINGVPGELN